MKEQIIQESINLFNQHGYKFSMESLSKNLKISKKTLYKYFSSKEEIISFIIDESFSEVLSKQKAIFNSNLDTETKLRKILTTNFMREDSIDLRKAKDIYKYYPKLAETIESKHKEEWEFIETLLIKGKEEGIFEYWSIQYTLAILKESISLIIYYINDEISYTKAIDISMNKFIDNIKIREGNLV